MASGNRGPKEVRVAVAFERAVTVMTAGGRRDETMAGPLCVPSTVLRELTTHHHNPTGWHPWYDFTLKMTKLGQRDTKQSVRDLTGKEGPWHWGFRVWWKGQNTLRGHLRPPAFELFFSEAPMCGGRVKDLFGSGLEICFSVRPQGHAVPYVMHGS